ncbi:hypothetical protein NQ314_016007 [Rhamnusium bicolor]|uniref:Prefoldin subunit 5 n=1 Tax=Rhamnusium bicolor TaxID=1586634 RepID=A0AAV8WXG6_9CUCU|nr:hypothetical protein NQ314_016007 [Rhamnusium bicolor]
MAQISATEQRGMQQIDLTTLNIQQLSTLKQQLDQELNLFQESLASLKGAQSKFQNSGETLEKITPESEGKYILVPLTGSDIDGAKDYFQRKIKFVTEQMEKIQYLGLEKSKIRDAIVEIADLKMAQQQQS